MNAIGANPLLPVADLADQLARPIVNQPLPRDGSERTLGAAAVGTGAPPADASCAEQPVRFRRRGPLLQADDWAALREYARLLGREKPRKPYIPAPVSDEQFDADRAREEGDWCGND